jgi:hypothetical protein
MISAEISEAGLEIVDVESLRLHYARTLDHWSERLEDNLERPRWCRIRRCVSGACIWPDVPTRSRGLDQPAPDSGSGSSGRQP